MHVLILGADGYLGWPSCMYFSKRGHEVMGVDNYFRRRAAMEHDCEPLVSNPNLNARAKIWKRLTGLEIQVRIGDVTDYGFLKSVFEDFRPDVVVHFAEQPSAPYSMMSREHAAFTVINNLISTLNVIHAVKEVVPQCHIIKLGTMGEYGTPNIDIEEGWIEISHKGRMDKFLFPRQASSLYHTTKIQDTDMLWFYVRTWGIRVTDLMQGPVYGISTDEADIDERLMPNFHYDEIFGTVLNRFIVQAVAGYPLTIYGKGNQKRGYINLRDSLACIYLSAINPPDKGELRIFNQITEVFSVNELADRVIKVASGLGYKVEKKHLKNPRIEKEEHYYNPTYTALKGLGLTPTFLTDEILSGMINTVVRYKENINTEVIFHGICWK